MKPKTPPSAEAVRLKMAALCARSEQCAFDIRQKILRSGLSSDQAEEILSFLKRERFVDDARFARAFAADKMRFARWGRLKIRQGLAAKRISASDIAEALDALDAGEYEKSLLEAAAAKARSLDLAKREDAIKLCRHLASRGFEHDKCLAALRTLRSRLREGEDSAKGGGK